MDSYDLDELDIKCEIKVEHEDKYEDGGKDIIILSSDDSNIDDDIVIMHRCENCDFTTSVSSELSNHVKFAHSVFTPWTCCVCHATEKDLCGCRKISQLKSIEPDHLKKEHNGCQEIGLDVVEKTRFELDADNLRMKSQQYSCHLCDFNSVSRFYLSLHLKKTHSRNRFYYCHRCNYLTRRKKELLIHIKKESHKKKKPLKCQLCSFRSWLRLGLKRHLILHHRALSNPTETTVDDNLTFTCPYCDFTYTDQQDMKRHKELKHRSSDLYNCLICDYCSSDQIKLIHHIETSHRCKCCSFVSPTASGLHLHLTEKHGFQNLLSVKSLNESENLHSNLMNDDSDLVSNSAGFKEDHLNEKVISIGRSTSGTKEPESCYRLKDYLRLHASTLRRGTKRFLCDLCNFSTNMKNQFVFHLNLFHRKSINKSVYQCRVCSYKNKNKTSLSLHVKRMHLNKKLHECDICDFKASQKHQIESHVESVHKAIDESTDHGSVDYVYISESSMNDSDPVQNNSVADVSSNLIEKPKAESTRSRKSNSVNISNVKPKYDCLLCNVTLKSRSDMVNHLYFTHLVRKCSQCEFSCIDETELCNHLTTVHNCKNPSQVIADGARKNNIVDPDCQIIEDENMSNFDNKVKRNSVKCYMCGKLLRFWIEPSTNGHAINGGCYQNSSDRFLCSFCYTCVTQVPSQYLLGARPHPKAVPVIEFFTCDICGCKTANGTGLNAHIRQAHSNLIFFKCKFCTFRIVGKELLDKHMIESHKDKLSVSESMELLHGLNPPGSSPVLNPQPLSNNMLFVLNVPTPAQQSQELIANTSLSNSNNLVCNQITYESSSRPGQKNTMFESSDFYVEVSSEQDNVNSLPENEVMGNTDEIYVEESKPFLEDNKKKPTSENESLFTDMEDVSWEEIKLLSEKSKSRPSFENYDMIRAMDIVSVEVVDPVPNGSERMSAYENDDLIINIDEIYGKDMKPSSERIIINSSVGNVNQISNIGEVSGNNITSGEVILPDAEPNFSSKTYVPNHPTEIKYSGEVESILPDIDPVYSNDSRNLYLLNNTFSTPHNAVKVETILPDVGPNSNSDSYPTKNSFLTPINQGYTFLG